MAIGIMRFLSVAGIAAPLIFGQPQGNLSGPTAGYVFDRGAHALRPVVGIPGASFLGDPLKAGFDLSSAVIAPRQDAAIVTASDRSLHFLRINGGELSERKFSGGSESPQAIVFSPSGTAAALYAGNRVQIVTGLPDAPALAGEVNISADMPRSNKPAALAGVGRHSWFAVSDDGAYLLLAAGRSVRLLGLAGGNRKVMDTADSVSVAFAPGGHDGAVSDPDGTGVVLFRDLAGASQQSVVAAPDAGMASPVGLGFSSDGQTLYLAAADAKSVIAFDLKGGTRNSIACSCVPAGFTRMGNVFRLNDVDNAPLWLLDAAAAEPRIVFVPALSSSDRSPAARF